MGRMPSSEKGSIECRVTSIWLTLWMATFAICACLPRLLFLSELFPTIRDKAREISMLPIFSDTFSNGRCGRCTCVTLNTFQIGVRV